MAEISTLNGYKIKDKKAIRYYNTVADMVADTTLKNGMQVKTSGYYQTHDNGQGEYKIIDDNTLLADNGSIIALQNGLYAKIIINDKNINVKQFGAKGDNYTDDSQSIYKAVNYALDNNLDIYLPEGTYLINTLNTEGTDAGLYIDDAISIIGSGKDKTIIKTGSSKTGLIHLIYIKNAHDVKIKSLSIDGGINESNPVYPSNSYCHGIRVANSTDIIFEDLMIKNVSGYGIGLEEGSSQNLNCKDLFIKNTGRDGIDTKNFNNTNENFTFDNITFDSIGLNESAQSEGLTALDIRCKSANVSNIYIKNLTANNSGVRFHSTNATQGIGGKYGNATNIQVYGNSTGEGIAINETGVKISNAYVYGMGIGVRITTEKNQLTNIIADTCSLSGFRIDQTGNMLTNCTSQNMTNNTNGAVDVRDGNQQFIGFKVIDATVGFTIYAAAYCKLIGCSFLGTVTTPINRLANCEIIGCYGVTSYTNQLQVLNGLIGTGINLPTTDSFNSFYSSQANETIALVKGSSSSVSDAPSTNTVWNVLSIKNSANYGSQFAFSNSGLFFRGIAAGSWDTWTRIS